MPRLIFISPHFKSGAGNAAHLSYLVRYIATREGAAPTPATDSNKPSTQKQAQLIRQIVKNFPLTKKRFEYQDYLANPTIANASDYLYFGAGGALGFDTIAAKAVLTLQQSCPQIKLILVLPCKTQTRGWEKEDIAIYEDIKNRCNKVVYTSEDYARGCMLKRNRHLVDNSSACVCYLTESKGGTAYTVDYARRSGIKIVNLA